MITVATVSVLGYVGSAKFSYTAKGTAMLTFSVATNSRDNGEEVTTWWRVRVFGRLAEVLNERGIGKGTAVFAQGECKQSTWLDDSGNERHSLEVLADHVSVLPSRNEGQAPPRRDAHPF